MLPRCSTRGSAKTTAEAGDAVAVGVASSLGGWQVWQADGAQAGRREAHDVRLDGPADIEHVGAPSPVPPLLEGRGFDLPVGHLGRCRRRRVDTQWL